MGIPFPSSKNTRIMEKKSYINSRGGEYLTGDLWYEIQALRAVNQSVGRILRDKNDYGIVILCD